MSTVKDNSLRVPYGLAVHGIEEEKKVLQVLRSKKTSLAQETETFEKKVAKIFGKKYGIMVNSGSSANLLAVELLHLPAKSEVITPVLTFATTVSPLVMKGLIPVFTDVVHGTYQIDMKQLEAAVSQNTKAFMIPLLLGNAADLEKIAIIAKKYKLPVILDSCDTLGATFNGKKTGAFGDICTTSFYGSHIITAGGNGGMLLVDSENFRDNAKILRGWGRGSALYDESEAIEKRYQTKIGNIPYDAKFIFAELGYNFLPMEMGSAFGNAQLLKLNKFSQIRKKNFKTLLKFFQQYERYFILPQQDVRVYTQWLSFPLTIKNNAPFSRFEIVSYLEENNIQTRPIFTGIITKQPGFTDIPCKSLQKSFPVAEEIMERGFVVGCHQGLTDDHINKLEEIFIRFLKAF